MGLLLVKGVLFLAAPVRLSWRNYSAAGGLISRGTFSPILPGECGSSLPFECQSRNGMLAGSCLRVFPADCFGFPVSSAAPSPRCAPFQGAQTRPRIFGSGGTGSPFAWR